MHSHLFLTNPGGLWFTQDVLKFMQESYSAVLDGIADSYGEKCIVSGVKNTNGTISNGWVVFGGEIIPFVGGTLTPLVDVEDTIAQEQYDNATLQNFYFNRRLKLVSVVTGTSFPFTDLVRPTLQKNVWNTNNIKHHKCDAAWIAANLDPATWEALPASTEYGWKVDLDAGGRVIMGWHPADSQPVGDEAWSADAHVIGRKFGERLHKLLADESGLPDHDHDYRGGGAAGNGAVGIVVGNRRDNQRLGGSYANPPAGTVTGGAKDAQNGHNNVQPSIVYLTLVKM